MAQIKSRRFNAPKPMNVDGRAIFVNDTADVTVAQAVNDTIDFKIPAGMEVSRVAYHATDMDTGTPALAFKVGYAAINASSTLVADDDYFSAAKAIGQAVGGDDLYFPPITFEEDVYLRFTCTTIAATFAAGVLSVSVAGNCVGPK